MNYEQKYKEALERAKKLQETCDNTAVVGWCEYILPELKESDDERIRKGLVKAFGTIGKKDWGGLIVGYVLAWLEKQGKSSDKAEPRFKVGDKVVAKSYKTDVKTIEKVSQCGTYWTSSKGYHSGWWGEDELEPYIEQKTLNADDVIEWIECKAFQGWAEEINIKQIVDKFKKDFGL